MIARDIVVAGSATLFAICTPYVLAANLVPTTQPDSSPATQPTSAEKPDPRLSPADVVHVVVEALRHNDDNDSGIRTSWLFASPSNKVATGPIERFIPLVKNPAYLPLLNARSVVYHLPQVVKLNAQELVEITQISGTKAYYVFQLSKQTDGPLKDCWMTDGVIRVQPSSPHPDAPPHSNPPDDVPRGLPA